MTGVVKAESTIGIIGGGQLGRMLAHAASEMGYHVGILDPALNAPATQVSDWHITAAYDDPSALAELASRADVITYEFENVGSEALYPLEQAGVLPQGRQLLHATQHRLREKTMIVSAGLQVAPFHYVNDAASLVRGIDALGFPCVLKTCTGGYDGKGQVVLQSTADIARAEQLAARTECILEGWVAFQCEVSVIVCRNANGQTEAFPVSENVHHNNILHLSIVPARVSEDVQREAERLAVQLADYIGLVGILAVEMFVTADGTIFINELAPRPHNSGHYTMNSCNVSQFQQHVRSVTNLPLVRPVLRTPVVMVNVLGQHLSAVIDNPDVWRDGDVHLYGKAGRQEGRKMGHINVTGESVDAALQTIHRWNIWNILED
ncbi:MAG: 5-(carboxyamino)imidazole ribonucleotide synthase [Bacilli bacterium]